MSENNSSNDQNSDNQAQNITAEAATLLRQQFLEQQQQRIVSYTEQLRQNPADMAAFVGRGTAYLQLKQY